MRVAASTHSRGSTIDMSAGVTVVVQCASCVAENAIVFYISGITHVVYSRVTPIFRHGDIVRKNKSDSRTPADCSNVLTQRPPRKQDQTILSKHLLEFELFSI
jgi:hypothetical protein